MYISWIGWSMSGLDQLCIPSFKFIGFPKLTLLTLFYRHNIHTKIFYVVLYFNNCTLNQWPEHGDDYLFGTFSHINVDNFNNNFVFQTDPTSSLYRNISFVWVEFTACGVRVVKSIYPSWIVIFVKRNIRNNSFGEYIYVQ